MLTSGRIEYHYLREPFPEVVMLVRISKDLDTGELFNFLHSEFLFWDNLGEVWR